MLKSQLLLLLRAMSRSRSMQQQEPVSMDKIRTKDNAYLSSLASTRNHIDVQGKYHNGYASHELHHSGETTQHVSSYSTCESRSYTLPGQYSRAGTGGGGMCEPHMIAGELALLLVYCEVA